MGEVVQFPGAPAPGESFDEDTPFTIVDRDGNEAYAADEASAMAAAYELQRDHAERWGCQGSGQQTVVIYFEGSHVLTIDRRIRHEEVH